MSKITERLQKTVSYIEARRFASVKELGLHHQVSEMTIRRDLDKLAQEGRIIRTFGGGVPISSTAERISSGSEPIRDDDEFYDPDGCTIDYRYRY